MDYIGHFVREIAGFEAAARAAAGIETAPAVPSCPGWVVTDLVLHLGMVHRLVACVIGERMQEPPGRDDRSWLELTEEWTGWLPPGKPSRSWLLCDVPRGRRRQGKVSGSRFIARTGQGRG
ncbi:MAG: maleylpyruvate isomerase N-terminal domain-containing protein [Streptosporangiaceae bacterium]